MHSVCRTRTAFYSQPAHHLLLDASYPMTPEVLEVITKAVENVLALACSLYGGVRIPGIGVSLINNSFTNILKVIPIRGNAPKIFKSMKSLNTMLKTNDKNTFQEFLDILKLSVIKILEDYGSKSDFPTKSQETCLPQFVVITLVTFKDGIKIQSFLEDLLDSTANEKVKRIHVLQVFNSEINIFKKGILVDIFQVTATDFKLEQFFKQWLLDCDTTQEHACINFYNSQDMTAISIKCDITDNIVNPFLLPFGHCYQIQTDYFKGSGIIKFPAKYVPIYELHVKSRISGVGLCESLLFGPSQRLLPTKCWNLEGEELIRNQQYFYATCKQLQDKDEYLLVTSSTMENNLNIPGHFILIPGKCSLLLRAVAPSELVLPHTSFPTEDIILQNKISNDMSLVFSKLTVIEDFTPNKITSNLFSALKSNLNQKTQFEEKNKKMPNHPDHPALDSPHKKLCHTKKRRLF